MQAGFLCLLTPELPKARLDGGRAWKVGPLPSRHGQGRPQASPKKPRPCGSTVVQGQNALSARWFPMTSHPPEQKVRKQPWGPAHRSWSRPELPPTAGAPASHVSTAWLSQASEVSLFGLGGAVLEGKAILCEHGHRGTRQQPPKRGWDVS